MPQISKEKEALVVEKFFYRKSYLAVQAAFQQQFYQAPPCKKTIQQNVRKAHSHGASVNRNKENSGRRGTARSEENIELIRNILKAIET